MKQTLMIRKKINNIFSTFSSKNSQQAFTASILIIVTFVLASCGGKSVQLKPPTIQGIPSKVPPAIIQALNDMATHDRNCPATLTADLYLRYTSPLKNETINGYLQFSQPTNYKFSITNPFGQPVWVLAGNNQKFQLLDIAHKSYTSGKLLSYIASKRLPAFLAEGNWGEWLTGRNFTDGKRIIRVDDDSNGRGIWLTLPTKTAHAPYTQLLLNKEMTTLLARVFLDKDGKKLAEIRYQVQPTNLGATKTTPSAIASSLQCHQPESIHFSGLGYGSSIELRFSQVEFSSKSKTYTLPQPGKGFAIQFRP